MIPPIWTRLARLWHDDRGTTAIEYALIAMAIAMAVISALRAIGPKLEVPLNNISKGL